MLVTSPDALVLVNTADLQLTLEDPINEKKERERISEDLEYNYSTNWRKTYISYPLISHSVVFKLKKSDVLAKK